MKIRRATRGLDLRNLPLDGFDMFLLTRLEGTVPLALVVEMAPCDASEALRRLHNLARMGVVELVGDTSDQIVLHVQAPRPVPVGSVDDALTLRPPRPSEPDDSVTLRPPRPVPVEDLFEAAVERTSVSGVIARAKVGIEFQTPREVMTSSGESRHDRSVFSRATLVDEDVETRAKLGEKS